MQADINSLVSWCQKWNITLNMSKCIVLWVSLSSSTQTHHFSVDGVNIMPTTSTHTDLGIIVSNNLYWLDHYDHICNKAYRALNMIRRVLPANSSTALKKRLYVSLVRSHLTYCSQLWRPRLIKDIKRLEQVQRRCTKFILQDYSSTYKSRLRALNLLPLMLWYELQDIMFLVKCLKEPMHSCQPSRNGRDSPEILGLVPVVSRLSRNLRAPCASAFTRLDGRRSLNRV